MHSVDDVSSAGVALRAERAGASLSVRWVQWRLAELTLLLVLLVGCVAPRTHATLYAAQIVSATQTLATMTTSPTARVAVERAQRLGELVASRPLDRFAHGRRVGAALVELDAALQDVERVDSAPELRARVELVQLLVWHLRLALAGSPELQIGR